MKRIKYLCYCLFITSSAFLSGCNLFPEPATLIQAPTQSISLGKKTTLLFQGVKEFIPSGSSQTAPNEPVNKSSIIEADFNGDTKNEVVIFYKSNTIANKVGAAVLQDNEQWEPLMNVSGNGYEISWGSATDLDGDGISELLIGWKTGVSAGNVLDVYKWVDDELSKVSQLNYHELELIEQNGAYRLAVWRRMFDDVYNVDVLKWQKSSFVSDSTLYPSYFLKVADYYQQRADAVPDAAHYWYYLADSLLKANQPVSALHASQKGMTLSPVDPPYEEYEKQQKKITEYINRDRQQDVDYYVPYADITLNIPKQLAPTMLIEGQEGDLNEYVVNVYVTDQKKKGLLFSIEIHSKDFITKEELQYPLVFETSTLYYIVREPSEHPLTKDQDRELYAHFNQALRIRDEMIASIRLGAPFSKHVSTEEALVVNFITEANKRVSHVNSGGEVKSEVIESFTHEEQDYRFLGEDINTREKLVHYLSSSFTKDAIEEYMKKSGVIEQAQRLAQPNADGGSLLSYPKASVLLVKDLGSEKQFDLRVPLGNSLAYEVVHITLRKTEEGWRISSSPLSL